MFDFDWVDAFTSTPFGGNACVVVHGADHLSLDDRMRLVRETSLSECAYLVHSDVADFGARYYLAEREILMAGHPTVATVASLLARGMISSNCEFTLEVGAGVLPIAVIDGQITMTQAAPQFLKTHSKADIAAIYGLDASDIVVDPQVVSTGTPFCIALLKDHSTLRRATLDEHRLQAWRDLDGNAQAQTMEPFLVALGGIDGGDTFSRLLLPHPMPAEDPFTGSATGCMAAYLWAKGLIDAPHFIAEQGHWLGRPGTKGVVLMSGQLHL